MSRQPLSLKCPNCGHEFTVSPESAETTNARQPGYSCPVCQYLVVPASPAEPAEVPGLADIQAQIDLLLRTARANGVPSSDIVELLRDELQFEAELAQAGRHMVVQIIDLGPRETMATPGADPHSIPNMRSANS
ncbi:MAG: hypothetical protein U0822_06275 [Anaerolineae bacterium]